MSTLPPPGGSSRPPKPHNPQPQPQPSTSAAQQAAAQQATAAAAVGAAAAASGSPTLWGRLGNMIGQQRMEALKSKAIAAKNWAQAQSAGGFKIPSVDVQVDVIGPNVKKVQLIAQEVWAQVPDQYRPAVTHGAAAAGGAFIARQWTMRRVYEEEEKRKALQGQVATMLKEKDARENYIERLKREGPNAELELRYSRTIAHLSQAAVDATTALLAVTGTLNVNCSSATAAYPGAFVDIPSSVKGGEPSTVNSSRDRTSTAFGQDRGAAPLFPPAAGHGGSGPTTSLP